ncbi:MAG TPA: hypothetical protein VGB83_03180 [Actinomycetota bacterium]
MFREPRDEKVRRRVGRHATWQVVLGSVFAVFGVIGFFVTRQWEALAFAALATLNVLYWNPVRKNMDDGDPPSNAR